ncbi:MAG: Gfo/Idh/MocA family oxidoreductase [Saprospiraceae bacterium]|nr:Gfo/Idh/MocA family oxidoreductase [Saprospiraceae bacterium]
MKRLKIGVLGAGHLGKIHIKCIQACENLELVGFFDPHPETAKKVAEAFNTKAFDAINTLFSAVDIVDIVTPTVTHFDLAVSAAEAGRHIFIEKPLTHTVEEAEILRGVATRTGVKIQVGHVERFNPAFLGVRNLPMSPMFIEAHRLAQFNPRGTDVSVVLDLMIHDLDLILHLVKSEVKEVHASGVAVVSATPDIANARIEFENGCVANVTASRMSLKQMRKVRLFQPDAYISLDFLEKNAQIIRLLDQNVGDSLMELDTSRGKKWLDMTMPDPLSINAIQMELESFATSILTNTPPLVSLEDGYRALKVAHRIIETIGDSTIS